MTPGQRGDVVPAPELVGRLPPARILLADAAYDSNAFRASLAARGTLPVIEANPGRKRPVPFDEGAYKLRNLIERAFLPHKGLAPRRNPVRQARTQLRRRRPDRYHRPMVDMNRVRSLESRENGQCRRRDGWL